MGVKAVKDKQAKRRNTSINRKTSTTNNLPATGYLDDGDMTGRLEQTFKNMCMANNIIFQPSLKIHSVPHEMPKKENVRHSPKSRKLKDEKPVEVNADGTSGSTSSPEGIKTSFTTIRTTEYFQPKIEFYPETSYKSETVRICGWKLSESLLDVLLDFIKMMSKLSRIHFWRVGLTSEQIITLADFLSTNETITHLTLDANEPVKEGCLASLIQENSGVTRLQLRYCNIGPQDAKHIAERIGTLKTSNTKLVCLDLTGNKLGDEGMEYLTQALRTNRSLLTLSLCGNGITDAGCIALAPVLSQYFLTHEEVVYRRNLQSLRLEKVSPTSSRSSPVNRKTKVEAVKENTSSVTKKKDRPGRGRGQKEPDVKEEKPVGKGRKADKTSPKKATGEDGGQKLSAPSAAKNSKSGSKSIKPTKTPDPEKSEVQSESEEAPNPVLQKATYVDPHGLRITGNFLLTFLNLARNQITEKGLKSILEILEFQSELVAAEKTEVNGTGLTKVILWGNDFASDSSTIKAINELTSTQNPLRKRSPSTETEAELSKTVT